MAATFWNSAKTGTRAFTGFANTNETFSSDGPRKIFYSADGSIITPGNLLFATNGGLTLQKPDLAAADGISTHTPGFLPFFGTSAAAPHAAAIAALVRSARPTYTVAQVKAAMTHERARLDGGRRRSRLGLRHHDGQHGCPVRTVALIRSTTNGTARSPVRSTHHSKGEKT